MTGRRKEAPSLGIAILGAGLGSRFGGAKLDHECAGSPLGEWALRTARLLNAPIAVIVGAGSRRFTRGAADLTLIANPCPALGQGSSVALAAQWALNAGHEHLLIMLADMPLVTGGTLEELAARCGKGACACAYPDGRAGVPACFPGRWLDRLARIPAGSGAAALLQGLGRQSLVRPDPYELIDVDRPEDLLLAERHLLGIGRATAA